MIEYTSRLLSRPLVNGTTQKEHILLQPLIMLTKAVTPLLFRRMGEISPYVSSLLNKTFTPFCPVSASSIKPGKVLYASGPTTRSTSFSSSINFDFNLSAMHPKTPTSIPGFCFFIFLNSVNLLRTVSSAFSRMEHVFKKIRSASSKFCVTPKPLSIKIEAITSLSAKFIAQP